MARFQFLVMTASIVFSISKLCSALPSLSIRSSDEASFPNPAIDPFYQAPSNISSYAPGGVIKSRPVLTTITGRSVKSYQMFYRTTGPEDQALGTVATLWVPTLPSVPPKILSFQFAEDSTNLACSPSWAFDNATSTLASSAMQEGSIIIPWALSQGYYIVSPDYEGPQSAWLVGYIVGQATLDGIRAVNNYLNCSADDSRVALYGYSGAAQATAWASSLAAAYASDLNIVGAAFGGTPVDLQAQYDLINGGPFSAFGGGAMVGLGNGYPEVESAIQSLLTEKGKKIFEELQQPDFCILADPIRYAGLNFSTLFTTGSTLSNPLVATTLANQALLSNVSHIPVAVPKFPRLEYHGLNDTVAPVLPEIEYVRQQCAKGADIRLVLFPGMDHNPSHWNGLPGAMQFVAQALDDELEKSNTCGENITLPALGSNQTIELFGVDNSLAVETLFKLSVAELADF